MQLLELEEGGQGEPLGLPMDWPVWRYNKANETIYSGKGYWNFFLEVSRQER